MNEKDRETLPLEDTIQISTTEITDEAKRLIERYVDLHIDKLESLRKKENERSEF